MKWMFYLLIAAAIAAHYVLSYLNWTQRNEKQQIDFTIEMSKTHPIFIHPLQSEDK